MHNLDSVSICGRIGLFTYLLKVKQRRPAPPPFQPTFRVLAQEEGDPGCRPSPARVSLHFFLPWLSQVLEPQNHALGSTQNILALFLKLSHWASRRGSYLGPPGGSEVSQRGKRNASLEGKGLLFIVLDSAPSGTEAISKLF